MVESRPRSLDNLTHTLTGLALSRAGFNRLSSRSAWILVLAANAPDMDVVTALAGKAAYLTWHRNFTHSVLALPLVALLPVAVVRLASRKPVQWPRAWLVSMAGVASHLVMDWTNIYGIRLFVPVSDAWRRLDITSVIDPWIWAALGLSVVAPALAGLVGSEIGEQAKSRSHVSLVFALAALLFVALYDGARLVMHARAIAVLDARVYEEGPPRRVAAFPHPWRPLRWHGLVDTGQAYRLLSLDLDREFDPASGEAFFKPEQHPAMDVAAATPGFRALLGFSQYPLWTVTPAAEPEGAVEVRLLDLRFGTPREPGFVATALVDARNQVLRSSFEFGGPRRR